MYKLRADAGPCSSAFFKTLSLETLTFALVPSLDLVYTSAVLPSRFQAPCRVTPNIEYTLRVRDAASSWNTFLIPL